MRQRKQVRCSNHMIERASDVAFLVRDDPKRLFTSFVEYMMLDLGQIELLGAVTIAP